MKNNKLPLYIGLGIAAVVVVIVVIYFAKKGGTDLCKENKCDSDQYCNPNTGKCMGNCDDVNCPSGKHCDNATGKCVANPSPPSDICSGVNCPLGEHCDVMTGKCVSDPSPPSDICLGVNCPSGEYCDIMTGKCVSDPSPTPSDICSGVKCKQGYTCNPDTGHCVIFDPNGNCNKVTCSDGMWCNPHDGTCIPTSQPIDMCHDLTCPLDKYCNNITGQCLPGNDKCANVTCLEGTYCDSASGNCSKCGGRLCAPGMYCKPTTGLCVNLCDGVKCETGKSCDEQTGRCAEPNKCNTRTSPCGTGTYCDTTTGDCVKTPDTGKWQGWASTSQFGSGDGPWGNTTNSQISNQMTNREMQNMMGAAVPWRSICQQWKTKNNQVDGVVKSAQGKNTDKACWLIQPLNTFPNKLKGVTDTQFNTDMLNQICNGNDCKDINDDSIVATIEGTTDKYPEYLIIPFEGCGGDCKKSLGIPDCMNSCAGADGAAINAVNCNFVDLKNINECKAMATLQNKDWHWDEDVSKDFLNYSMPYGLSDETKWGSNMPATGDHLNWCSGQNMHFDMALDNPYWEKLGMGNIARTNADSNIIVRYKQVPCNIYGNFDTNPPSDPSVYMQCPNGMTDCGGLTCDSCTGTIVGPGDEQWPGSNFQNHSCCDSNQKQPTQNYYTLATCPWDTPNSRQPNNCKKVDYQTKFTTAKDCENDALKTMKKCSNAPFGENCFDSQCSPN